MEPSRATHLRGAAAGGVRSLPKPLHFDDDDEMLQPLVVVRRDGNRIRLLQYIRSQASPSSELQFCVPEMNLNLAANAVYKVVRSAYDQLLKVQSMGCHTKHFRL